MYEKCRMCRSYQLHGSYYYYYFDPAEAGVGQPVLMQKICLNLKTKKDLLRACHLNTAISEKTGLLEISLKNVLENFKVYWSHITVDLECQEEMFRLQAIGNHWKILSKEVRVPDEILFWLLW